MAKKPSKENVFPRSVATPWPDNLIVDAIRSGKLPVKPLPGNEKNGVLWAVCPASLDGYELPEGYFDEINECLAPFRETMESTLLEVIDQIEDMTYDLQQGVSNSTDLDSDDIDIARGMGASTIYSPPPLRCPSHLRHTLYKPDQFIGVVGIDFNNLDYPSRILVLSTLKLIDSLAMDCAVIGFLDTIVNVDGCDIYVQRQFTLKTHTMPADIEYWFGVIALLHLGESYIEKTADSAASWLPAHMATLVEMMDQISSNDRYSGRYLAYTGPVKLPNQPIFDLHPDCYRHAKSYLKELNERMAERYKGVCLARFITTKEFC